MVKKEKKAKTWHFFKVLFFKKEKDILAVSDIKLFVVVAVTGENDIDI